MQQTNGLDSSVDLHLFLHLTTTTAAATEGDSPCLVALSGSWPLTRMSKDRRAWNVGDRVDIFLALALPLSPREVLMPTS